MIVLVDLSKLRDLEEQIRREQPREYKRLTRWQMIQSIIEECTPCLDDKSLDKST